MIEKVKLFIENFFKAELDAHNADLRPDLDKLHLSVDKMYSYADNKLWYKLNMLRPNELPWPSDRYERNKNFSFQYPRFLFKLSEYKHPEYGSLYLAYVTEPAMQFTKFLKVSHCLFITQISGEYKIISDHFVYNENLKNIHWRKAVGPDDISVDDAGDFIRVERYQEPSYDAKRRLEESEFSKEEYNKDR